MGTRATIKIAKREEGVSFSEHPEKVMVSNLYIEDPDRKSSGIEYEYYIWGDYHKDIWISIFEYDTCIFVGKPYKLLREYE